MHRLSLVLALLAVSPLTAGGQPPRCEWTGSPELSALRVELEGPTRIALVPLRGRRAVVSPVGLGLFGVRTIDDGAPLVGTTREPIALVISGMTTLAGVATVAPGTAVLDLSPRASGLRGALAIAEGVRLDRVELPCEALGLRTEVASVALDGPPIVGPRWLARTRVLRIRARPERDGPRVTLRLDDRARHPFVERDRREGWVRVEARMERATLSGWVPDADLARSP